MKDSKFQRERSDSLAPKSNFYGYPALVPLTIYSVLVLASFLPGSGAVANEMRVQAAAQPSPIVLTSRAMSLRRESSSVDRCGLSAMTEAETDITTVSSSMIMCASEESHRGNRDHLNIGESSNAVVSTGGERVTANGQSAGEPAENSAEISWVLHRACLLQDNSLGHIREYLQTKK